MSNNDSHHNQIMKLLFIYFLGLLSGLALLIAFIKLAPEHTTYSFFNILDIEIETTYED